MLVWCKNPMLSHVTELANQIHADICTCNYCSISTYVQSCDLVRAYIHNYVCVLLYKYCKSYVLRKP